MKKTTMGLILMAAAFFLVGCSGITGAKIMADHGISQQTIDSIEVQVRNSSNPVDSKRYKLFSQHDAQLMDNMINEIKNAKSVPDDYDSSNIDPVLDSSHHIRLNSEDQQELEFFFIDREDVIIWVNTRMEGDDRIVSYNFLQVDSGFSTVLGKADDQA